MRVDIVIAVRKLPPLERACVLGISLIAPFVGASHGYDVFFDLAQHYRPDAVIRLYLVGFAGALAGSMFAIAIAEWFWYFTLVREFKLMRWIPGAEYPIGVALVFVLALAWAVWAP